MPVTKTKPDEAYMDEVIENDHVIKLYAQDVLDAKQADKDRIAKLKMRIKELWAEIKVHRKERAKWTIKINALQMSAKAMMRRTKHRKYPLFKIARKRRARVTYLRRREEDKFLREQREEFRQNVLGKVNPFAEKEAGV